MYRMASLPESKQDGQAPDQGIDLSAYEKDSALMYLAENNIYNDLKDLLKRNPYNLKDGFEIRVACALIGKPKQRIGT